MSSGNGGTLHPMKQRITVNEQDPQTPICPHCEKEIQSVSQRRVESTLGVRFLYYCAHCRKTLGISHRKGFWMG